MSSTQLRERIAALRADAREVGELLAQQASSMTSEELFEVTGELQGVQNCAEGAQLVAAAHAASYETRLTERGPVEVHHQVGFIDAMAGALCAVRKATPGSCSPPSAGARAMRPRGDSASC